MEKEIQHQIIDLFRQMDQALKRVISRKVADTGIYRSQHRLLMFLGKHPECSQTELAEKMDISPAAVAVSLKKLEKGGYINRQCNAEDNRVNHVEVTGKGKKAIAVSILYFQEIESAMFKDFSLQEMEDLKHYLERIIQNGEDYYHSLSRKPEK
ncbi:MAG: MarR family transcriptional regulator [Lachnospiraceae bacterium]|nr:MarR family transcriptional regulator [Lachnospiraceae bacterium]